MIVGNKMILWHDAPLWLFGYLQSSTFMAWVRAFSGRMQSDFMIAPSTVYFTFPVSIPTDKEPEDLENKAQAVRDARVDHLGQTLADLYDRPAMPSDLRQARGELDAVIDKLHGLNKPTPAEWSARLLAEHEKLSAPLESVPAVRKLRTAEGT